MKLAKIEHAGQVAGAVIAGTEVRVITPWHAGPANMAPFDLAMLPLPELRLRSEKAAEILALDAVKLVPPLGLLSKIICLGYNYRQHAQEASAEIGDTPSVFTKERSALVGQGEPVVRPKVSEQFDFEGEIAVVIGKAGRHIPTENAMTHVFGYTIMMDGSVRDYLKPTAGKNFFRSGSLGPWIVTSDEISYPDLRLETRLSGQVVQSGLAALMIFDIPTTIEYVSRWTELVPGDIISTGTPAGIGARRTPPLWMKPGDLIEVDVSSIGTLANSVVNEE